MKLNVWAIPESGKALSFSEKDDWVRESFCEVYSEDHPQMDGLVGGVSVTRLNELVTVKGHFTLPISPICCRCAEPAPTQVDLSFRMDLSPAYESKEKQGVKGIEEELELNADDIDFTFYEDNEIDLAELLKEQLVLNQQATYLCRPDCLGLCAKCKINKNKSTCLCADEIPEDSPWAALKQLKVKH